MIFKGITVEEETSLPGKPDICLKKIKERGEKCLWTQRSLFSDGAAGSFYLNRSLRSSDAAQTMKIKVPSVSLWWEKKG